MLKPCRHCRTLLPANQYEAHLQAHRNAAKPPSSQRGYGPEHRRLRREWAKKINAGQLVLCARCGRRIVKGDPWDLGHDDSDPAHRRYSGVEHASCNRATAGRRAR